MCVSSYLVRRITVYSWVETPDVHISDCDFKVAKHPSHQLLYEGVPSLLLLEQLVPVKRIISYSSVTRPHLSLASSMAEILAILASCSARSSFSASYPTLVVGTSSM